MNSKSATYTRLAPHCCGSVAGNHIPLTHLCFVPAVLLALSLLVCVFAAVMMIMIPVGNVWALTEVYLQHVLLLPLTSLHLPLLLFVSHPLIFLLLTCLFSLSESPLWCVMLLECGGKRCSLWEVKRIPPPVITLMAFTCTLLAFSCVVSLFLCVCLMFHSVLWFRCLTCFFFLPVSGTFIGYWSSPSPVKQLKLIFLQSPQFPIVSATNWDSCVLLSNHCIVVICSA